MAIKGKPLEPIRTDADHFMICPDCKQRFDMRDLAQVAEHVHEGGFEIEIHHSSNHNTSTNSHASKPNSKK